MRRSDPAAVTIRPQILREQDLLVRAWACAFPERGVIYLSGPITTGARFLKWHAEAGRHLVPGSPAYLTARRQQVTIPNEADLLRTATELRERKALPVLEPASLMMEGWSQEDYHSLWVKVIERFVGLMVVMPGWEYSVGSAVEFAAAVRHDIPVELVDGSRVEEQCGRSWIERAACEFEAIGVSADKLKAVAAELNAALAGRKVNSNGR